MLLEIPNVLDRAQLKQARETLAGASFFDGRRSAGWAAQRVKHNEEVDPGSPEVEALNTLVLGSLYEHPVFRSAALPHRVSGAYFARYTQGMSYGAHIDDPVMGEGTRYRSDIALTVFLNGPEEYDGGELVIRTAFGDKNGQN